MDSIEILPLLEDNYGYFLSYGEKALFIDASEADPVIDLLEKRKKTLSHILCTHHHSDHVDGNLILQKKTGCWIIGPNDTRIPGLEQAVKEGDQIFIGPYTFDVFETPGHTSSHIVFYLPKLKALFCGDLLFSAGCGRLFEGTAKEMWHSLKKVRALPDDTKVYPGHEYTLKNLEFAHSIEPKNPDVLQRLEEVKKEKKKSIPSTIGLEKKINPFLRVDHKDFQKTLQMEGEDEADVFAKIRELKDTF